MPADILVPAALENVITKENVDNIQAKIIVEMANGPITQEAYDTLKAKNIISIPDILANGGGVIVSYFEWLQNRENSAWTEEQVNEKLEAQLAGAFEEIWNISKKLNLDLKQSSFVSALAKITGKKV